MKIEVDVSDEVARQIAGYKSQITKLQRELELSQQKHEECLDILRRMSKAKDALLEAADYLDPYRYDDGP